MKNGDRLRAYQMRLSGMTWEAIGQELHYDGQTVKRDLLNSLTIERKKAAIRFPVLRKLCTEQFNGSVAQMAESLGISDSTFRNQMSGRTALSVATVDAVKETFGLTYEEAFAQEDGGL